ncbi:MAG: hypothetical protein QNJ00_02545 [Woeseiaceae bacterium]|nr:hypothetical protein [Woeseiaceae bacterium]
MGIFDNIARLIRERLFKPDMVHPVFGELMSDVAGDDHDMWQADSIVFAPLDLEIGLTIYAGENGPNEAHVEFYREFERRYEDEFARVAPALLQTFEEWFGEQPEFGEAFRFAALIIPRNGDRQNEWGLSFECIADPDQHLYTATLKGESAIHVSVDG